jgi:hypothetical protein
MQQRLVARAADLGKHWPELPVARKRAVLAALIERIEVSLDQIDIRLRPSRLAALFDVAATPSQGVNDDETEILSVPVRLRRAGREIRMVIATDSPLEEAGFELPVPPERKAALDRFRRPSVTRRQA